MAHLYRATVLWQREPDADFGRGKYSRAHTWRFDGGLDVPASASPGVVPKPFVDEHGIDPEEAFVASLSSCHMLTFLDLARRAGVVVNRYADEAEGAMEKDADGRWWVSKVTLRPAIDFAGEPPDAATLDGLHHKAHELCFIANSVKSEVVVEGR